MQIRELLILVGIPASGKTTYANKFEATHVIIGKGREKLQLEMKVIADERDRRVDLKKRIADAHSTRRSVIVDSCNLTAISRAPLIAHAVQLGMCPIAVYFQSDLRTYSERNMKRPEEDRVPEFVARDMFCSMEPPRLDEGFEEVRHVRC